MRKVKQDVRCKKKLLIILLYHEGCENLNLLNIKEQNKTRPRTQNINELLDVFRFLHEKPK